MPNSRASGIGRRKPSPARFWSRRVLPRAPNHKLGTLVEYAGLPVNGRFHRAQADAETAALLALYLKRELMERFGLNGVTHELRRSIHRTAKSQVGRCIERYGIA